MSQIIYQPDGSILIEADAFVTTRSQIQAFAKQGVAPFSVYSNTFVANLNVEFLNGQPFEYYLDYNNFTNLPILTFAELGDTNITAPQNYDILYYDSNNSEWINLNIGEAGEVLTANSQGQLEWQAPAGAGLISNAGTGGANRVTYWTDASTIGGDANFTWDGSDLTVGGNVGIGVTPTAKLHVTNTGSGDSFLVEDSANPDSDPFVITSLGNIVKGHTTNVGGYHHPQSETDATPATQIHGDASTKAQIALTSWSASDPSYYAPAITLAKSSSATVGTKASGLVSGEDLGSLVWSGDDGTSFVKAAMIQAEIDGTPGVSDMPGRLTFSTTAAGSATPTERMRIQSDGDVGIGTINPDNKLHVAGSISLDAYLSGTPGKGIFFRDGFNESTSPFNLAILTHDFNGEASGNTSPDALMLTGFDGVAIHTGSNTYDAANIRILAQQDGDVNILGNTKIGGSAGDTPISELQVQGVATGVGNSDAIVNIDDTTAMAADVGGTLALRGYDGAVGPTMRTLALIKGGKANATEDNFDGYLGLFARQSAVADAVEAQRLYHDRVNILKDVKIGGTATDTPDTTLDVYSVDIPDPVRITRGSPSTNQVGIGLEVAGVHTRWFGVGTDTHPKWSPNNNLTGSGDNIFYAGNDAIPNADSTYDLGDGTTPLRWDNVYADQYWSDDSSTRSKFIVWNSSAFAIGMGNNYYFGGLDNQYAMTFQMDNTANRGFWWGRQEHSNSQGAMSLTTTGELVVAKSLSIGFGESTTAAATTGQVLDIKATDSVANATYYAMNIDMDVSGADAVSGGNKNHIGLRIDLDSTATGGTTVNNSEEHQVHGALVDLDVTGDSDLINGYYSSVRSALSSGTVSNLRGFNALVEADPASGGTVTNAHAGYFLGQHGGVGTVSAITGSANIAQKLSAAAGSSLPSMYGAFNQAIHSDTTELVDSVITNAYASLNEVQIDAGHYQNVAITNARGVRSIIDINTDRADIITNGYLFYGDYDFPSTAGASSVTNPWGIYLTGSTANRIQGDIWPIDNNTWDLGRSTERYNVVYANVFGNDSSTTEDVTIYANDSDFTVADGTDSPSNFIWRDFSASKLYLGTDTAVVTTRSDVLPNADSTYDLGSDTLRWANIYGDNLISNQLTIDGNGEIRVPGKSGINWYESTGPVYETTKEYAYRVYPNSSIGNSDLYFDSGEAVHLFTITPGGSSRNYAINGSCTLTSSNSMETLYFELVVRANTLPNLTYSLNWWTHENAASGTISPIVWVEDDNSTTGGTIKFLIEFTGSAMHSFHTRYTVYQRGSYNDVTIIGEAGHRSSTVDSGYTEYTHEKSYSVDNSGNFYISGALEVVGDIFPGADSTYDLGSTSTAWQAIHGDFHQLGTTSIPTDFWTGSAYWVSSLGYVGTNGSFGVDIVANGYRNSGGTWTSFNTNSETGGAIVSLRPTGDIFFGIDNSTTGITGGTQPAIRYKMDETGFYPNADSAYDLGSNTLRWANLYVDDITKTSTTLVTNLNADLLDGQQGSYYLNTSTSFGGDVSGTYNAIVVANDSHTHAFDNLTSKTSGTGDYSTSGDLVSGRGSGGVALTINDGYGHANVTWNHQNGVPEQNGNAARIEVSTDNTTNARMFFEAKTNVTGGAAVTLSTMATMYADTGDLDVVGNVTAYSSDKRLKTNLVPITNALDMIDKINGYKFDWNKEICNQAGFCPDTTTEYGVIAQEIQQIMPELVVRAPFDKKQDNNGNDIEDPPGYDYYKTVKYDKLTALLIAAVKELKAEVEELKRRN